MSWRWNFFATSHGKGIVDGVGGTVKRYVYRKVLNHNVTGVNADDFVTACNDANMKPKVVLDNEQFGEFEKQVGMNIDEFFQSRCSEQRNISRDHCWICTDERAFRKSQTNSSESLCVSAEMGCVENQDSTSRLSVNQWVVVTYNAQRYPGKIVEVQENGYIISAMESLGAQQWRWPLRPDVLFYERSQVSACADPTMVGSRSRISFSFDF